MGCVLLTKWLYVVDHKPAITDRARLGKQRILCSLAPCVNIVVVVACVLSAEVKT
jgi:hypothetical protein